MSNVREIPWVKYDNEVAGGNDLVIIPVGAVEAYGPHLPLGSDGIVAEALAVAVATRVKAFVAPLIPVGYSKSLQEFPGTLSVSPEALKGYLGGIAESFIDHGCKRLLFINGHAGNVSPITQLMQNLSVKYQVRCAQVDVWRFIQPLSNDIWESEDFTYGHAGEVMTSVMLYIAPEMVNMQKAVKFIPSKRNKFTNIIEIRSFRAQNDMAVLGDATLGSKEKGKEIMKRAIRHLVKFIEQW